VCPKNWHCDEIHDLCVRAEQLTACGMLRDGDDCPIPGGATGDCDQGVCLEQICGDGFATGSEECDRQTTADCTALGFYTPTPLACTARCTFDELACAAAGECGDGLVNGPPGREVCDGGPPPGSCLDFGFEAGTLACNASSCAPAFEGCRDIGFVAIPHVMGQPVQDIFVARHRARAARQSRRPSARAHRCTRALLACGACVQRLV
jgi:hypothetical protein